MSIAATVGRPVVTGFPTCIHDGFVSFEHLRGVDRDFLFYVLKDLEGSWSAAGQTGSQTNVNTDIVARTVIQIPSDPREQRALARTLSDTDDLIAALERMIVKKQAIKQGMMQQLLTGKTRLPGFTKDWQRVCLGSVLRFQAGFPFSSGHFSEAPDGPRLVRNRDLRSDDSHMYFTGDVPPDFLLDEGDVLIGMDGDFEPVIWRHSGAVLNQRVGRLRLTPKVSGWFLAYALIEPLKVLEQGTGATTVKHLSHSDVEGLFLNLPSRAEQDAIAEVLVDVDREIAGLGERLTKARATKTGMMQELLTGRTRLPIEECAA